MKRLLRIEVVLPARPTGSTEAYCLEVECASRLTSLRFRSSREALRFIEYLNGEHAETVVRPSDESALLSQADGNVQRPGQGEAVRLSEKHQLFITEAAAVLWSALSSQHKRAALLTLYRPFLSPEELGHLKHFPPQVLVAWLKTAASPTGDPPLTYSQTG